MRTGWTFEQFEEADAQWLLQGLHLEATVKQIQEAQAAAKQ